MTMTLHRCAALFVLLASAAAGRAQEAPLAGSVTVQPTAIDIKHHRHAHALQILGASADGYTLDLRTQAKYASADAKIATVDTEGWVRPLANGQTQITVSIGDVTKTVSVKVQLPATEPALSFRHEVMPVLSRGACISGGCHGYSLGRNGFKLSLRGADPDPDFLAITKDSQSRRVSFQTPEASLMVTKPVGDVAHEGGVRFGRTSLSYKILTTWIRQGAPGDLADKAQVVRILYDSE